MSDRLKLVFAIIGVAVVATILLVFLNLTVAQSTVVAAILGGTVLIVLAIQLWPTVAACAGDQAWCDRYKACIAWILALGGGAVVVFVLVWVTVKFSDAKIANAAVALPLIVIVGVIVLLIVISLLTFTFSVLGLASPKEALGLPDGSVRAIIALMLLVLFSIVSIFLYNNVAGNGAIQSIEKVPKEQLDAMRALVTVVVTDPTTGPGPFKVYFRTSSTAGDDLAKQLMVLLGTLVTAVASFYFGANAVASATAAAQKLEPPAGPKATGVAPNPIKPDDKPQTLSITGTNLGNVTKLHLEQKEQADIDAKQVKGTDKVLTGQVTIPVGTKGTWNVVVDDGPQAVTIGQLDVKSDA